MCHSTRCCRQTFIWRNYFLCFAFKVKLGSWGGGDSTLRTQQRKITSRTIFIKASQGCFKLIERPRKVQRRLFWNSIHIDTRGSFTKSSDAVDEVTHLRDDSPAVLATEKGEGCGEAGRNSVCSVAEFQLDHSTSRTKWPLVKDTVRQSQLVTKRLWPLRSHDGLRR